MSCNVCAAETKRACASCLGVNYCSKECQQKDWISHREDCQKIAYEIAISVDQHSTRALQSEMRSFEDLFVRIQQVEKEDAWLKKLRAWNESAQRIEGQEKRIEEEVSKFQQAVVSLPKKEQEKVLRKVFVRRTLLERAVYSGNISLVSWLIGKKSAATNILIVIATEKRMYEIAELLLKTFQFAQWKDEAFKKAVHAYDTKMAKLLLIHGAKSAKLSYKELVEFIQMHEFEIFSLMIKGGMNVDKRSLMHHTILMQFLHTGNVSEEIVHSLLTNGADVNAKDDIGNTVLMSAVSHKNSLDVILALLSVERIDVNAKTSDGGTALANAVRVQNDLPIIAVLLNQGADPNAKGMINQTLLMDALYVENDVQVIALLIDSGADVKAVDADKKTTLMYAIGLYGVKKSFRKNDVEIVKLLIEAGVDVSTRDQRGKTALDYALEKEDNVYQKQIVDMLKAPSRQSLFDAPPTAQIAFDVSQ